MLERTKGDPNNGNGKSEARERTRLDKTVNN